MRTAVTLLAVVLGLLLAVAGVASAAPATPTAPGAAAGYVVCTGSETVTYRPGLLLSPRPVTGTAAGSLTRCSSSDRSITSGSYREPFSSVGSCSTLAAPFTGTRTITWSNGRTSTFSYTRRIVDAGGQTTATFTGKVISGEFTGATAIEQVVDPSVNTARCLSEPGLTQVGPGVATVTITG